MIRDRHSSQNAYGERAAFHEHYTEIATVFLMLSICFDFAVEN